MQVGKKISFLLVIILFFVGNSPSLAQISGESINKSSNKELVEELSLGEFFLGTAQETLKGLGKDNKIFTLFDFASFVKKGEDLTNVHEQTGLYIIWAWDHKLDDPWIQELKNNETFLNVLGLKKGDSISIIDPKYADDIGYWAFRTDKQQAEKVFKDIRDLLVSGMAIAGYDVFPVQLLQTISNTFSDEVEIDDMSVNGDDEIIINEGDYKGFPLVKVRISPKGLHAPLNYEDFYLNDEKIFWVPNNPGIATIENGLIKAVGVGTTKFTGYFAGEKVEISIEVKPNYIGWKEQTDVPVGKIWSIKFNQSLMKNTINNENIYITDLNGEKLKDYTVILGQDQNVVEVSGIFDYEKSYYLFITDSVKSSSGMSIKNPVLMKFTTQSKKSEPINHPNLILSTSEGIATSAVIVSGAGFPSGHWSLDKSTVYFDENNNSKHDYGEKNVKVELDEFGRFQTTLPIGLVTPGIYQIGYESDSLGCYRCNKDDPRIWQPHNIFVQTQFEVIAKEQLEISYDEVEKEIIVTGKNFPKESTFSPARVYIDRNESGKFDRGDLSVTVNPDNNFSFSTKLKVSKIPPKKYLIGYHGTVSSIQKEIDLGSPILSLSHDKGVLPTEIVVTGENFPEETSSFPAYVYFDKNMNGIKDRGEAQVRVYPDEKQRFQVILKLDNTIEPGEYQIAYTSGSMGSYIDGVYQSHNINISVPFTVTSESTGTGTIEQ